MNQGGNITDMFQDVITHVKEKSLDLSKLEVQSGFDYFTCSLMPQTSKLGYYASDKKHGEKIGAQISDKNNNIVFIKHEYADFRMRFTYKLLYAYGFGVKSFFADGAKPFILTRGLLNSKKIPSTRQKKGLAFSSKEVYYKYKDMFSYLFNINDTVGFPDNKPEDDNSFIVSHKTKNDEQVHVIDFANEYKYEFYGKVDCDKVREDFAENIRVKMGEDGNMLSGTARKAGAQTAPISKVPEYVFREMLKEFGANEAVINSMWNSKLGQFNEQELQSLLKVDLKIAGELLKFLEYKNEILDKRLIGPFGEREKSQSLQR